MFSFQNDIRIVQELLQSKEDNSGPLNRWEDCGEWSDEDEDDYKEGVDEQDDWIREFEKPPSPTESEQSQLKEPLQQTPQTAEMQKKYKNQKLEELISNYNLDYTVNTTRLDEKLITKQDQSGSKPSQKKAENVDDENEDEKKQERQVTEPKTEE